MKNLVVVLMVIFVIFISSCSDNKNTEVTGTVVKGAILRVTYSEGKFNPDCKIMVAIGTDTVMAKIDPVMMIPGKTSVLFHDKLPIQYQGKIEVRMIHYGKTGEYEIISVYKPKPNA